MPVVTASEPETSDSNATDAAANSTDSSNSTSNETVVEFEFDWRAQFEKR